MAGKAGGIEGATVLIVEDEYYLADDLSRDLRAAGARVAGPVGSRADAVSAVAAGGLDAALLDLNLHGEMGFAVAEQLRDAGVPFVIVSGYGAEMLPPWLAEAPRLTKPVRSGEVLAVLSALLSRREGQGDAAP